MRVLELLRINPDAASPALKEKLFVLIKDLVDKHGSEVLTIMVDRAKWEASSEEARMAANNLSPRKRCTYGCQDTVPPSKLCQCYTIDNRYGVGSYCSGCFEALALLEHLSTMKPFVEGTWIKNRELRNLQLTGYSESQNCAAPSLICEINAALSNIGPKNVDRAVAAAIRAVIAADGDFVVGPPCVYGCDNLYTLASRAAQEVPMCSSCHAAAVMIHAIKKAAP
jgi:hypothetical protein